MSVLTEKEWVFLNEIVHMIYATPNLYEMRSNVLELLTILIPNSSNSFYLANSEGDKLFYDPVSNNISQEDVANYLAYGEKMDYTVPIFKSARPIAYRETDLFADDIREKTEFYNEFLAHGLEYPLALSIARDGKCYGALSLFRSKKMGDFSDRDVFILTQLHKHLATRICLTRETDARTTPKKISDVALEFKLTAREQEIMEFILEGISNEEIGQRLYIEIGTVKKHIYNIYSKLDVKNRIQLMRFFR